MECLVVMQIYYLLSNTLLLRFCCLKNIIFKKYQIINERTTHAQIKVC